MRAHLPPTPVHAHRYLCRLHECFHLSVTTEHFHERRLVFALEKIVGNVEQLPVNINACVISRRLAGRIDKSVVARYLAFTRRQLQHQASVVFRIPPSPLFACFLQLNNEHFTRRPAPRFAFGVNVEAAQSVCLPLVPRALRTPAFKRCVSTYQKVADRGALTD